MNRGWYGHGYLVRALNEFASLTARCGAMDASHPVQIRAKASTRTRERQRTEKTLVIKRKKTKI